MNRLGIAPPEIPAFARALGIVRTFVWKAPSRIFASSEVFTTEQSIEQEKN